MQAIAALEALGQAGVTELLLLRPDLARPRPTSTRELAQRAVEPVSLSAALGSFDVPTLQVAETLAALGGRADRRALEDLLGIAPGNAGRDARDGLDRALDTLRRSLFLEARAEPRLLPEIVRAWPEPLGYGPPAARLLAAMPVASLRQGLSALGVQTRKTLKADLVDVLASALADDALVRKVLEQAPPTIAERIRAAAFGRPLPRSYFVTAFSTYGLGRASATKDPTLWALAHLLAVETYEAVVLPAEVTRALRGPDWHVDFTHAEPPLPWAPRPADALNREASSAAGHAVRTVSGLVEALARRPAQRLKTGALGVRELRRLGKEQGLEIGEVRLALALAHQADLIAATDHGVAATPDADIFLRRSPAERAAQLMAVWLEIANLPMLDAEDAWYPQVRRRLLDVKDAVLAALAHHAEQSSDPASLTTWLRWRHPVVFTGRISAFSSLTGFSPEEGLADADDWDADDRDEDDWDEDVDPDDDSDGVDDGRRLVDAVLVEAAWLGVAADHALTGVGLRVLQGDTDGVRDALDHDLGAASTTARLQADLTAVVLGHPAATLSATLDELATRESRSVATTWRFSPASIRAALDDGWTGDQVLDRLTAIAEGPVPQPLTYLVHDVARRHGHLRGGAATCYLRGDDPGLLREVAADRRLSKLGLRLLGDGVLIGDRPLDETLADLRKAGYAPVAEDRAGHRVGPRRKAFRTD